MLLTDKSKRKSSRHAAAAAAVFSSRTLLLRVLDFVFVTVHRQWTTTTAAYRIDVRWLLIYEGPPENTTANNEMNRRLLHILIIVLLLPCTGRRHPKKETTIRPCSDEVVFYTHCTALHCSKGSRLFLFFLFGLWQLTRHDGLLRALSSSSSSQGTAPLATKEEEEEDEAPNLIKMVVKNWEHKKKGKKASFKLSFLIVR